MSDSKPRGDSVLDKLSPSQQEQLEYWLFEENITYVKALERISEDWCLKVSQSSLSCWRQRVSKRRMMDRIANSTQTANEVVAKFRANPGEIYEAVLARAGQIAFDKSFQEENDIDGEMIFNMTKLVMLGKKLAQDDKKLAQNERDQTLAREKFEHEMKDDAERGIEALFAEVKPFPEALELLQKIKAIVRAAKAK